MIRTAKEFRTYLENLKVNGRAILNVSKSYQIKLIEYLEQSEMATEQSFAEVMYKKSLEQFRKQDQTIEEVFEREKHDFINYFKDRIKRVNPKEGETYFPLTLAKNDQEFLEYLEEYWTEKVENMRWPYLNAKARLQVHKREYLKFCSNLHQEETNLASTSAAEKIRYLYLLGIIDHLKSNSLDNRGVSDEKLALILAKITGENQSTIARSLRAISNNTQTTSKNPTANEKEMQKARAYIESKDLKPLK